MAWYAWLSTAAVAAFFAWLSKVSFALQHNIAEAKHSAIPYIIVPVHITSVPWLIAQAFLLSLLKRLPASWTEWWLPISLPQEVWHHGYDPFKRVGADTFLAISPFGKILWTCDPDVILDTEHRRSMFPKPHDMMQILNVYGPTLTASEGEEARVYRKIAAKSFNDATIRQAWHTTLKETSLLLGRWIPSGSSSGKINDLGVNTGRLALHVIASSMFGKRMDWADSEGHHGELPEGHELSFSEAIAQVMEMTQVIFFIPKVIVKYSPLRIHRRAKRAYNEWRTYMQEMHSEKLAEIVKDGLSPNPNFLDAIVQAGMPLEQRTMSDRREPYVPLDAVMGNMFIMFFAGHDTSANTMTFAMVVLACLPQIQKKLQAAFDQTLGTRAPAEWTYERDFPSLLTGYPGCFLNEVLRLFSILPFIPKCTQNKPQQLTVNGRQCLVPANTIIMINTSAAHRNPNHWPERQQFSHSPGERKPYPIASFNPDQWEAENWKPRPGAFIPFSEGSRSCLGQRLAKAELIAVLARIFRDYSVELAVDEPTEDKMSRTKAWESARSSAENALSEGIDLELSLKLMKKVGLVFVKRGSERWFDMT